MADATQALTRYIAPERMTLDQAILAWLDEKRASAQQTPTRKP